MKFKKMIVYMLLIATLFSFVFTGPASAESTLFDDSLKEGQGYQINNFAIMVGDVFPGSDNAVFRVYELPADKDDEPIEDEMLGINDSFKFQIDGEDVEVTLLDVQGSEDSVNPPAKFAITVTDDDVINFEKEIDRLKDAEYIGEPELELTKTVDNDTVKVGDIIRVNVDVKNTGDGDATDIRYEESAPAKFVLEEYLLKPDDDMSLDEGDEDTVYIYTIKATQAGEFEIDPTTAKFSNELGMDTKEASSNTPKITVEGETPKIDASLNFKDTVVSRGESTEVTLLIKNEGEGDAEDFSMEIQLPEGLEYEDGSDEIEIISGTPTIYQDTLGSQQTKEYTFTLKANEIGDISVNASYSYTDEQNQQTEDTSGETESNVLQVTEGKYDFLFEQPLYVYIVPVVIILGAAAWIYYRRQQYRL
ncbi:MAG: BatD family protein [Methanohalophilus sp.]